MPAYVLSPAVAVARISNVSPTLTVPLRVDSPSRRVTGIGSPVSTASSIIAPELMMIPSIGITSPARTRMTSPTNACSIGMSAINDPCRRWAILGARSIKDFRSRSARAIARSSSTLPPAYITATTTPARFSLRTIAADIETNAIASTPMRPAKKSRIMEMSSPTKTGAVPAAQIQFASSARPTAHVSRPRTSPPRAMTIRVRRRKRSVRIVDI